MDYPTLKKTPEREQLAPNLARYEETRRTFDWASARSKLSGLPNGRGLNMAHEAVDRHAAGPLANRIAIRWLGKSGERVDLTYARLAELSGRFAGALEALDVKRGDRVFVLSGRLPELYVAALGALKRGAVFCPLFSAFGPEPIRARMAKGGARGPPARSAGSRSWHTTRAGARRSRDRSGSRSPSSRRR